MKHLSELPDAHLRIFERPELPPPDEIESVHLVGVCGTGMGSLAGLLVEAGYHVRGSDENCYPPMSTRIEEMGIELLEGFDAAHLDPEPDLVVVGNACTPTHPEAAHAREHHMTQVSFPEALSHFFLTGRRSLVVAGTHGKTTTTGMLVHVLREAGLDPGFLVGGVMLNGNVSYGLGTGPHFVVEGDEYDSAYFDKRPKMMHYQPAGAVVTSMEFDHADIYSDWKDYRDAFRRFARLVDADGLVVLNGEDANVRALEDHTRGRVRYIGLDPSWCDVAATSVHPVEGGERFTLVVDGTERADVFLPMSGYHNVLNALAVCALALDEGVSPEQLATGFASFKGLRRRQEVRAKAAGVIVIDDFAHHPTAVRKTIESIAARWPNRRIVAVFEPRSNSSRRKVFEVPYGNAFDAADYAFISSPPLRHNDDADAMLDVTRVVEMIEAAGTPASAYENAEALLPPLLNELRPGDVALIMSNGSFGGIHDKLIASLEMREQTSLHG
ncbi:MAG: UDP-N-acetylmuramate:L-alanyl-gamma-D-glutamyl-meso-diaminopimelate ligase [Rhodothermales bacterium]